MGHYDAADIARWRRVAIANKATHILVMCDTFSYEDYPVYVMPGQDPNEVRNRLSGQNMQQLHETIAINSGVGVVKAEGHA